MQEAIRCKYAPRFEIYRVAFKICKGTSGFSHENCECSDVENAHVRFDHHIEPTACEQVVMQKISVAANAAHPTKELTEVLPTGTPREALQRPQIS